MDFHPHLHALVADGLFVREGQFHTCPEVSLKPLEQLFRARLITFLAKKGLLPEDRAQMLRGWVHSGFNVYRSRRVPSYERDDMERLAQYIIRNPFSVEKMKVNLGASLKQKGSTPRAAGAGILPPVAKGHGEAQEREGVIIYRSEMNEKIHRNFEVFSPCDFIATITQHIPDKSFQLVRYYGWYSNKMRGQRAKREAAAAQAEAPSNAVEVTSLLPPDGREGWQVNVSEYDPPRIPSAKWRELIKKVWEADPLLCPRCGKEMRIVALIDQREVIERILRHLGLWQQGVQVVPATGPPIHKPALMPGEHILEPWLDDPLPDVSRRSVAKTDYDAEVIYANG